MSWSHQTANQNKPCYSREQAETMCETKQDKNNEQENNEWYDVATSATVAPFDYEIASAKEMDSHHHGLSMLSNKFDIFISYRRSQKGYAGRLCQTLENKGFRVFMDIKADAKRALNGNFQTELMKVLKQCKVMLVLITPGPSCDRVDDPRYKMSSIETMLENKKNDRQDWVYDEIATALEQNVNCIPLISGGEGTKWRGNQLSLLNDPLLSGITALSEQNCFAIHEEEFYDPSVDALALALATILPTRPIHLQQRSLSSLSNEDETQGCLFNFLTEPQRTTPKNKEETTCLLLGDGDVGKTCLIGRMIAGEYKIFPQTIMPKRTDKKKQMLDEEQMWYLWDAPGQAEFEKINNNLIPDAHFFCIAYDVTNRTSFENVEHHLNRIRAFQKDRNSAGSTKIMLVANKIDIPDEQHKVTRAEGLKKAARLGLKFEQVSAKSGQNVGNFWQSLAIRRRQWLKLKRRARENRTSVKVTLEDTPTTQKECPCVIM